MTNKFEWDSRKSDLNKGKHGIDFETGSALWRDANRIEIHAPHPTEDRWIMIGKLQNKIWAVIYTIRQGCIRIISVRRAREKEISLYEN